MIFLLIFIVIFLIAVVVLLVYYSRETKLADAIALYENGQLEDSVEMLKNYLTAKSGDVSARKLLAKIYFEKNEYVHALKECISITINKYATFKEKADAYALMAKIYVEQALLDKAAKMAIEGFRLDPKNPEIHFQLGVIYSNTDKMSHAIKEFNLVLSVDRTHIPARLKLASIHAMSRDEVKAMFQYKKILEYEPNNKDARLSLARMYYVDGDLKKSSDELLKMKDISGYEVEYHYMLTNFYLKTKQIDKAKEIMENIVLSNETKDDKLTFMRYELGVMYQNEGKLEEAYDLFHKIKLDIPRYRDIDTRIQRLKKILHPEEHAQILDSIDYNALSSGDFEDLFYLFIDKLGYKEVKLEKKNRNEMQIIAVEKFKTLLQGKYIILVLRKFDMVTKSEVEKFVNHVIDEGAVKGIMITTNTYDERAINYVESLADSSMIELLDKVNIYELVG